jgi:integrase/recombinase XerD
VKSKALAPLIESFFTKRLVAERRASSHTVAAYRDTFRLLLRFAHARCRRAPSDLVLDDLDAPLVLAFLADLEKARKNAPRTRNVRLAAIRSFFAYLALEAPEYSHHVQRVLAIPSKRFVRRQVDSIGRAEVDALLAAPDRQTRAGRRDHAIILVLFQTGLRVSELVSLRCADLVLGTGAHVRCCGKGRKERCTPLFKQTARALAAYFRERDGKPDAPLFTNARGGALSTDGVRHILEKHRRSAAQACPSLARRRVTPHILRHSNAMEMLAAGVDRSVIALWLGHESVVTTQMYLDASMHLKEKALARVAPGRVRHARFRAGDRLLAFLESL